MTVFNGQKYLAECLNSILAQTFKDFEFIIVDDASTDSTAQILSDFVTKDNRIKVLRNESNLGIYKSANIGLQSARGEYIARIDADDTSIPERFEIQLAHMERHKSCLLVGSGYRSINVDGIERFHRSNAMDASTCRFVARFRMPMVHPSFFFRARLPSGLPVRYEEKYPVAADYALASSLGAIGNIASIGSALVNYRMHPTNVSSTKRDLQLTIARQIASVAVNNHYTAEIAGKLQKLLDLHYSQVTFDVRAFRDAVTGLNSALAADFGRHPPAEARRRAAGILAEGIFSKGGRLARIKAGLLFPVLASNFVLPLAARARALRN